MNQILLLEKSSNQNRQTLILTGLLPQDLHKSKQGYLELALQYLSLKHCVTIAVLCP